jgi:hypothetical protein
MHVQLERVDDATGTGAPEVENARDTSVDHTLDAQLGQARRDERPEDLLKHVPADAAQSP